MKRLVLLFALLAMPAGAATPQPAGSPHDFDFAMGTFHTHIRKLAKPLSGSQSWVVWDGIKTDVPILDGTGSLEQIKLEGPSHLELMTVRLYDAASHQWRLYFGNNGSGELASVPSVGGFKDGVGTFLDQEDYHGRTILVRQLWTAITPNSYHFEQAFSADFGKTWEPNFIADLKRS